ncbi:GDP-L-fucose synthase [Hymenobacter sp. BT186]|uniref:GDP-L-fucose synthase n=1 Tax=Hymenobacter telluris TaxID=2816474 RepID=A0A939EWW1_9BACT|nr:GDP-L-fucose synthase [Hymenobacter telluris]MBO0357383.1 GDP-L-fucose synthase [Hymenobacter telluris]MBW3373409.1 GDP-L-fucose synthase [Hymenobacter norwichensis]
MEQNAKIYIAGHRGMVGSAILRRLEKAGYHNFVTRTSSELDLRNQQAVTEFFAEEKPDYVVLAAAKVGGINANNIYRAEFLYDNLMIQNNVIHNSYLNGVKKLLFLGSSCIYPKLAPQPLQEDALLTGTLESTNEPYAIAKIAGIKLCDAYRSQYGCNYISAMPTNLYGPHDNYDLKNSHVLPALIRKFHEAKLAGTPEVEVWGTGTPRREFLHVDDLAEACYWLLENYNEPGLVNVGTGTDLSIRELAELVQRTVGYEGTIRFNTDYPDGTPRKLMDVSKLAEKGWKATIGLEEGVAAVYADAFGVERPA